MGNEMDKEVKVTTSAPSKSYGQGFISVVFIALVVSMVTAITVVAVYDGRYAQKIMTMDLKGYIRDQRDKAVKGEISEEELRDKIDAMEELLMAVPANHIVLLKEVVLRNAREINP